MFGNEKCGVKPIVYSGAAQSLVVFCVVYC